jgi:hypothetical protein
MSKRVLDSDYVGTFFEKLLVLRRSEHKVKGNGEIQFVCRCMDCGNERDYRVSSLKRKSAGGCCLRYNARKKDTALRDLYIHTKCIARNKGRIFDLSLEDFKKITSEPCFYTGRYPNNQWKTNYDSYTYNGLDRVDNKKGYTIENVVPCCKEANRAKSTLSLEEFKNLINDLYIHFIKNNGKFPSR